MQPSTLIDLIVFFVWFSFLVMMESLICLNTWLIRVVFKVEVKLARSSKYEHFFHVKCVCAEPHVFENFNESILPSSTSSIMKLSYFYLIASPYMHHKMLMKFLSIIILKDRTFSGHINITPTSHLKNNSSSSLLAKVCVRLLNFISL